MFQYFNCIGGIVYSCIFIMFSMQVSILQLYRWNLILGMKTASIETGFNTSIVSVELKIDSGCGEVVDSFNTSIVSVECADTNINIAFFLSFNTSNVSVEYFQPIHQRKVRYVSILQLYRWNCFHSFFLQSLLGFNTSIVSVEFEYQETGEVPEIEFQYFNCIGGIILN